MNDSYLEQYFEKVILPQYSDVVSFAQITWKDHGKVGLDTWAHYFEDKSGVEYVLLYEDYPGDEYLSDSLTHEIVKCGDETSIQASLSTQKRVDNIIGYFTLYKERRR